jgi:hypothetical protein
VLVSLGTLGMFRGKVNEPFVTTFLVCPAVFAVLIDKTMTNAAL